MSWINTYLQCGDVLEGILLFGGSVNLVHPLLELHESAVKHSQLQHLQPILHQLLHHLWESIWTNNLNKEVKTNKFRRWKCEFVDHYVPTLTKYHMLYTICIGIKCYMIRTTYVLYIKSTMGHMLKHAYCILNQTFSSFPRLLALEVIFSSSSILSTRALFPSLTSISIVLSFSPSGQKGRFLLVGELLPVHEGKRRQGDLV